MTLDGFGASLFVRPALEKQKQKLKKNDSTLPLPPYSPIKTFTQGHLR